MILAPICVGRPRCFTCNKIGRSASVFSVLGALIILYFLSVNLPTATLMPALADIAARNGDWKTLAVSAMPVGRSELVAVLVLLDLEFQSR